MTDVDFEKTLKEDGEALEGLKDSVAEAGGTIHQEQAARHEAGGKLDAAMGLLVESEVVGFEREGEGRGLTEAESHAFAGDGVDGTGGVADEGDVAGGDTTEFAAESDGASGGAAWL